MNYRGIIFFLGIYSLFISFFCLLNILYSIYFNFFSGISSYLFTLLISLSVGSFFYFVGKGYKKNISSADQVILIVLSFLLIPVLISIPYLLSSYNLNFLNSYFESISGFTTTGFSIIQNTKFIDEPLLLWRSSSQWIGGLVFLISLIGTLATKQVKIKPGYLLPGVNLGGNFYNNFNSNFILIFSIFLR